MTPYRAEQGCIVLTGVRGAAGRRDVEGEPLVGLIRRSISGFWDVFRRGPDLRRLIRRVQKLETRSKAFKARWETEHLALKNAISARRRRVLSPDIVRSLLPVRLATIRARASDAHASAVEQRLEAVSDVYSKTRSAARQDSDSLVRTELDGVTWWVPVPPSVTGTLRKRFVNKQRFPYRNITQAREFAVGAVMLDIGANIGRMSIPRVILGDVARTYCAEPDPLNYIALVRNVVDNGLGGLVLPDQAAIGATNGTASLRHAKYSGGHHLVRDQGVGDTIEVPCWRLDDWCERLGIDPDLITYVKVDTQGWELDVLRGAPGLLARQHIAWQLEISPTLLAAAGGSAVDMYRLCADHFSHFVDLGKLAEGRRARPTRELGEALAYLEGGESQTDVILFRAQGCLDG